MWVNGAPFLHPMFQLRVDCVTIRALPRATRLFESLNISDVNNQMAGLQIRKMSEQDCGWVPLTQLTEITSRAHLTWDESEP